MFAEITCVKQSFTNIYNQESVCRLKTVLYSKMKTNEKLPTY